MTWIVRPTLASLRNLLDDLEAQGWSPDQLVEIKQLVNAPSVFTLRPVEVWAGRPEALPEWAS